jgi:uncharacterized protein YehS (DUF1456 family)
MAWWRSVPQPNTEEGSAAVVVVDELAVTLTVRRDDLVGLLVLDRLAWTVSRMEVAAMAWLVLDFTIFGVAVVAAAVVIIC